MNSISYIDIAVILIYFLGIVIYGLSKAKRKNSEDYFLGGRSMNWVIVGISLFSANISSTTLVGLASDGFLTNVNVYNYEWYAVIVLIFFAIFFLPFYIRSGVYTMPEFLERRYDIRSRYYFSFITIIGNILVDTAAALYVGSIILKLLFPEVSSTIIIFGLAIAAAIYTIPGGLNSVIQTEVVQAVLLVVGSILLTFFAFDELGGGWSMMMDKLDIVLSKGEINFNARIAKGSFVPQNSEEVFSLVRPNNDEFMPWWGLLTGVPLLGFYFWANNQFMVQRVLGAKSLEHGRWGALFAGFLKLLVLFIMVVPGVLALLLFRDLDISSLGYVTKDGEVCASLLDCANLTYPVLLFKLLPTGILGLVIAGLLAAMMSSVSAIFNSASTLITMDFVQTVRPKMSSKQLVRVGQLSTLILVVLASAWVPFIEKISSSLWSYLQLVIAYTSPPAVSVFILGLFWKRANADGAFYSMLSGFFLAVFMIISQVWDLVPFINDLHFLAKAMWLFVFCLAIHITISTITKPPSKEKETYVYKKAFFDKETEDLKSIPFYLNYRILSVLLLIITAIIIFIFW